MLNGLKFGLVALAAVVVTGSADACWARRNCCPQTVACAPACAPAPQYVEQKVTAYRCVVREREVEVTVNRLVPREVEYKYVVNTMVNEPVKRMVTRYECVPVERTFKTTVMEMVNVPEKRKVTEYVRAEREVEYKYIENVYNDVKEKKTITTYKCESHVVEECVPVCRKCLVRCPPDPCACGLAACLPRYQWVTVVDQKKVCRTVVTKTPVVQEVECVTRVCKPVERTGKRTICELTPVEREVTVNVCKCVPVERTSKCTVLERRAINEEVTVNVCKCVPVEHTGKKTVYDCVPTKTKVKQCYTEMEPYETTVRVAAACPTPDCGTCGTHSFRLFGCR